MKDNFKNNENKDSNDFKNIWKFLVLVFVLSFIFLNWSDIYWVFNPKVAPQGIKSLINDNEKIEEKDEGIFYDKKDSIVIPKIDITAPIVVSDASTNQEFEEVLKRGVAHFPDSVYPGKNGTSVLLGHSAPPGWPKIDYDWIFSDLENLEKGDEVIIYFEGRMYNYIVSEKIFLEIGDDVPSYSSNQSELVLLSCWPPGKNIKRIGIRASLNN